MTKQTVKKWHWGHHPGELSTILFSCQFRRWFDVNKSYTNDGVGWWAEKLQEKWEWRKKKNDCIAHPFRIVDLRSPFGSDIYIFHSPSLGKLRCFGRESLHTGLQTEETQGGQITGLAYHFPSVVPSTCGTLSSFPIDINWYRLISTDIDWYRLISTDIDWWWRWRRNVSFSLSLCISISLLRPYTFFSRSPLVLKTLFENACEL